jgi:hypothetical protein
VALESARTDAGALDRVFRHALRHGALHVALEAARARGRLEPSVARQLEVVTLHARMGNHEAARAELDAVDLRNARPVDSAAARVAGVNLRVRWDETPLDDAGAERLASELDAAERSLATVGPNAPVAGFARELRVQLETARALVAARALRFHDAERQLRRLLSESDADATFQRFALGDVLWARGDQDGARESWSQARSTVSALSPEAEALDRRLERRPVAYRS